MAKQYPGIYRATVYSNKDPLKKRRLRLIVPVIGGDAPMNWAYPLEASSVKLEPPATGQGVWVMFENGDPAFPVWVGTFGKELSKKYPLLANRIASTEVTPQIVDLLSLKKFSDGTNEVDLSQTLLNIVRNRYHGEFFHTGSQTATLANTAYVMPINTTQLAWGMSIVGGNTVRINEPGIYNLAFSAQFSVSNSSENTVDVWFRQGGVNVPNSNGRIFVKSHAIAAWNYFVEVDVVPQDVQLVWATSGTNVVSLSSLAASGPAPATPALILTVNKVK